MIDLVWNFPLLPQQQELWSRYLAAAMDEYRAQPVESLRPSFRTIEHGLRERAARLLGFPVERTWLTCGGHHGTLVALLAAGLAGERIVVEGDSYPGFLNQCRLTKTSLDACEIDDCGFVVSKLREICEAARAEGRPVTGLFSMPTVQNPIGFVTPLARREEIVALAREWNLKIIEDDAYGYMEPEPQKNYAELAPERAFYVRGLAKSFAPGARTGFLIAPGSASAVITTLMVCTTTGTPVPQNMASLAMMEDGTLDRLMEEKRAEGAARNAAARELLGDAGLDVAPGAAAAWHLWVRLDAAIDTRELEKTMADRGVMLSSGHYSAGGPGYGLGVRIALGAEIERARTLEGVRVLAETLQEL
jgi:DNA-binding transcriptional MocR family regulator